MNEDIRKIMDESTPDELMSLFEAMALREDIENIISNIHTAAALLMVVGTMIDSWFDNTDFDLDKRKEFMRLLCETHAGVNGYEVDE